MANEKNLIPYNKRSKSEARENGRKGGKKSGEARREKKTVQKILADMLDMSASEYPQFAKLAGKIGLKGDKSIKEVFTMVCLLNSLKSGNLAELERIVKLLGEETEREDANEDVEKVLAVIKECAYADRDKP